MNTMTLDSDAVAHVGDEPAPMARARGMSLFWRTFCYLLLLLAVCITAWFQTFRWLEIEPRALQSAQQLASLVNLSRAALVHADPIERISLVKTLLDEEAVRIAPREPADTYLLLDQDALSRRISQEVQVRLGQDTLVARDVNGFPGMWIGFSIERDAYWLLTDPERVGKVDGVTWLVWLGIGGGVSLLGAALIAGLINRPLKSLSFAAGRVREGDFESSHLDEGVVTAEIREVNIGFNRMAQQLNKVEQDRAMMLAGISHDLRTPLARLRLEAEMSVADPQAREHMVADLDQVNAIIDKFLDYARPDHLKLGAVDLSKVVETAVAPFSKAGTLKVRIQIPPGTQVLAEPTELGRVFANLLENARRYGRGKAGMAEVDIVVKAREQWILIKLRDHGSGVEPALLEQLTQPFYRGNQARTSATGAGLGLAIVEKAVNRMGGRFALANSSSGGLAAHIKLQKI